MIAVAGFNTAIDKYAEIGELRVGSTTRMRNVRALPGGKGIHVALAAAALGEPVRLVGCVDAANARRFEAFLSSRGVELRGVAIDGDLRTCLAIRDRAGRFTELLESGAELGEAQAAALVASFLECCEGADLAVLSGSLPPGLASGTYAQIARELAAKGIRTVVDASGAALREAIACAPFAVKPNSAEAAEITGLPVDGLPGALDAARHLGGLGIDLAVVSAGGSGAAASWRGRTCQIRTPALPLIRNPVGAGDCLVGGLAVGLAREQPVDEVLRLAVACGSAKVLCPETGFVRREDIERLHPAVAVEWI